MHILKYTNMQVAIYSSMRVCKCVFLQVFKYAGIYIQVWCMFSSMGENTTLQVCKCASMQVGKYKYSSMLFENVI